MVIELSQPQLTFDEHFNDSNNKRIIFSGKFGSGKTYFLKQYFSQLEEDGKINALWLSPVKYSTSQNEDIFEYIKIDIANQLLLNSAIYNLVERKFGESLYLNQYINSRGTQGAKILISIFKAFIVGSYIAENGLSDVGNVIDSVEVANSVPINVLDIAEDYKKFKNEIDKKIQEEETGVLADYIKASINIKGSIFEDDVITRAIRIALERCSEDNKKQNILIIDDFDRLDPEHIFRILNILSVHNDHYEADNKFGFDKIVIVCDIKNIELIYKYKYGDGVDFEGYIAKFFSTQKYYFSNASAIQNFCTTQLKNIITDIHSENVLSLILSYLVEKEVLNIRSIMKFKAYKYVEREVVLHKFKIQLPAEARSKYWQSVYNNNKGYFENDVIEAYITDKDHPFIQAIKILCIMCGDYDSLLKKISDLEFDNRDTYGDEYIKNIMVAFLALLHQAQFIYKPEYLLFDLSDRGNSREVLLSFPSNGILGKQIIIPIGWGKEVLYDGTTSYYVNVTKNLNDYDISHLELSKLSFKQVFDHLKTILLYLHKSGKLLDIGITKSSN